MYNENGLRVRKTVNGVVTDYTLHGKNIVHMTSGGDNLHFFYDANNKPAVVVYNGVPYSYVKNLQGDIVAILNSAGIAIFIIMYTATGSGMSTEDQLFQFPIWKKELFRSEHVCFRNMLDGQDGSSDGFCTRIEALCFVPAS